MYMKSVNLMFTGGLILALVVENSGLHRRIALALISVTGDIPSLVMMSFMLATALLSMFISNTATTAMMLPLANAVVDAVTGVRNKQIH